MHTFQTTDLRLVERCESDMLSGHRTTVLVPMATAGYSITGVIASVVKSKHGSRYLSEISIRE